MLRVATQAQAHEALRLDLDAIVRGGARRMLAVALEPRSTPTSARTPPSGMSTAGGWWSATATPASARC